MDFNEAEQQQFLGSDSYNIPQNSRLRNEIMTNDDPIVAPQIRVRTDLGLPNDSLAVICESFDTDIHLQQQQQHLNGNNSAETTSDNSNFLSNISHELQGHAIASSLESDDLPQTLFEELGDLTVSRPESEGLSQVLFEELQHLEGDSILSETAAPSNSVVSSGAGQVTCDTINTSALVPSQPTRGVRVSATLPNRNRLLTCKWPGCGKTYVLQKYLIEHEETHKPENQLCCDRCGKTFSTNWELERHKTSHSNNRNHKCSVCKKAFKTKSGLIHHEKTHITKKKYFCHFCRKGFSGKLKIKRHLARHDSENWRVECFNCQRSFAKEYLSIHMQKYCNGPVAEKPVVEPVIIDPICRQCQKKFKNNRSLATHMRYCKMSINGGVADPPR